VTVDVTGIGVSSSVSSSSSGVSAVHQSINQCMACVIVT
jgi:hypothetical protein